VGRGKTFYFKWFLVEGGGKSGALEGGKKEKRQELSICPFHWRWGEGEGEKGKKAHCTYPHSGIEGEMKGELMVRRKGGGCRICPSFEGKKGIQGKVYFGKERGEKGKNIFFFPFFVMLTSGGRG